MESDKSVFNNFKKSALEFLSLMWITKNILILSGFSKYSKKLLLVTNWYLNTDTGRDEEASFPNVTIALRDV